MKWRWLRWYQARYHRECRIRFRGSSAGEAQRFYRYCSEAPGVVTVFLIIASFGTGSWIMMLIAHVISLPVIIFYSSMFEMDRSVDSSNHCPPVIMISITITLLYLFKLGAIFWRFGEFKSHSMIHRHSKIKVKTYLHSLRHCMQPAHLPSNNCSYKSTVSSLPNWCSHRTVTHAYYWSIENFSAGYNW